MEDGPWGSGSRGRTLAAASRGEPQAAAEMLPLVYEELLALARSRMARLPSGNTLQPTALIVSRSLFAAILERGRRFAAVVPRAGPA